MRIRDTLNIAFMNLWRRKMRAFLTVLGMVIGVASIVVMVSLGLGINQAFDESYASMGSLTTITVQNYRYQDPESTSGSGAVYSMSGEVTLDSKVVNELLSIQGVTAVMPLVQTWGYIKSGQYVSGESIMGVDLDAATEFGFDLAEGRMPNSNTGSNIEVVFGSYSLMNFYNPKTYRQAMDKDGNPKLSIDKSRFQLTFDWSNVYDNTGGGNEGEAQPKGKYYKVTPVGILAQGNNSYYTVMDINALKKLARENKNFIQIDTSSYNQVWVKCEDTDTTLKVNDIINQMGFSTYTPLEWIQMQKQSTAQLQMLLGAIGGVALLVAAIGIMNTMMMSIYERTKEIGIIKVLGCRMSNIATLFLTEAAFIGLIGGAIGLGISYGLSFFLNASLMADSGLKSVIPIWLSLGGVLFSIVVALVSGMYPAIRAMRLSALSAIRAE